MSGLCFERRRDVEARYDPQADEFDPDPCACADCRWHLTTEHGCDWDCPGIRCLYARADALCMAPRAHAV